MNEKIKKLIQIQNEAEKAHIKIGKKSITALSVGSGKSWLAINRLKDYKKSDNIIFTGARKLYLENFKKEMKKAGVADWIEHIHFCCIASLSNYKKVADFVIIDEAHIDSERSYEFCKKQIKTNSNIEVLGLTGTPGTIHNNSLLKILPISYSKLADDNVKNKTLNDYRINIILHDLDNTPGSYLTKKFQTTEKRHYAYLEKKYKSRPLGVNKFPFELSLIKQFLGKLSSKERVCNFILQNLPQGYKKLIYCGSIEQTKKFNYPSYHSKNSESVNKKTIEEFSKGFIDTITNVNGLREAISIPDLKYGIVLSAGASKAALEQIQGK
jgi:superfamily II DNA or RNA helicase